MAIIAALRCVTGVDIQPLRLSATTRTRKCRSRSGPCGRSWRPLTWVELHNITDAPVKAFVAMIMMMGVITMPRVQAVLESPPTFSGFPSSPASFQETVLPVSCDFLISQTTSKARPNDLSSWCILRMNSTIPKVHIKTVVKYPGPMRRVLIAAYGIR